jgi:large subunit ribosomal protein L21e
MPHANGYRARTRYMFSRAFRQKGMINLSTYLKSVKVGDLVDIVANAAIHKGMPHKYYHGRTGTVFNVTPHAVGVEVNKQVGNRIIKKHINVRVEHVRQSKCRKDFLDRVKKNEDIKRKAKADGGAWAVPLQLTPRVLWVHATDVLVFVVVVVLLLLLCVCCCAVVPCDCSQGGH